jgi:hypothetical protein
VKQGFNGREKRNGDSNGQTAFAVIPAQAGSSLILIVSPEDQRQLGSQLALG